MSAAVAAPYIKPWISIPDQVTRLQSRGLIVNDRPACEAFLGHFNYYRFTGYCLAFRDAAGGFLPGVTFEHVKHACQFDANLRDLFTEALELIEIDIRTLAAHSFGEVYGPFGHTDDKNFHPKFDKAKKTTHADWCQHLWNETTRSKELFVKHFKVQYLNFPDLPIWIAMEVMSFGCLSRMLDGMRKHDRQNISSQYGLSHVVLASLTRHLVYVRNLCAHHCRLWDRIWSVKPELPNEADWKPPQVHSNARVFASLLLMRKLLLRSPHIKADADCWRDRVTALVGNPPTAPKALTTMGFTADWEIHPTWFE